MPGQVVARGAVNGMSLKAGDGAAVSEEEKLKSVRTILGNTAVRFGLILPLLLPWMRISADAIVQMGIT